MNPDDVTLLVNLADLLRISFIKLDVIVPPVLFLFTFIGGIQDVVESRPDNFLGVVPPPALVFLSSQTGWTVLIAEEVVEGVVSVFASFTDFIWSWRLVVSPLICSFVRYKGSSSRSCGFSLASLVNRLRSVLVISPVQPTTCCSYSVESNCRYSREEYSALLPVVADIFQSSLLSPSWIL